MEKMTIESRSPVLRTPRLALFVPTDADRADVARLCADPQVMACFPRPLTSDEADAWFERIRAAHARDGFGVWTVKVLSAEGETFAGVVGLARPAFAPERVEILWRFLPNFWGRGYATEAARSVLAAALLPDREVLKGTGIELSPDLAATLERLGLEEIVAFTAAVNVCSEALKARLGMTHDPADDFDHPALSPHDRLSRHVLYRMSRDRMVKMSTKRRD